TPALEAWRKKDHGFHQIPLPLARAATTTPAPIARSSCRHKTITVMAVAIARSADGPLLAAIGNTAAATIEPGSASSIRRMRGVSGTCPIAQNPTARITNVVAAMTTIATRPSRSSAPIEYPCGDASGNGAGNDEPPSRYELACDQ